MTLRRIADQMLKGASRDMVSVAAGLIVDYATGTTSVLHLSNQFFLQFKPRLSQELNTVLHACQPQHATIEC